MQPLIINLTGQKIVIVGGGRIAARKAKVLEAEQVNIVFIAPEFSKEVVELSKGKGYTLINRKAEEKDIIDAILVILATNDRAANETLAKLLPSNQLVCVVDEFGEGNVTFPATVRRGYLQLAVTSNGSSPKLTRKLKLELESQFDHSWETYTAFLFQCRVLIKKMCIPYEEKEERLIELLDDRYRLDERAQIEKLQQLQQLAFSENYENELGFI